MRPLHFLTTPWYFLSLHKTMSREDVVVKDEKGLELGKGSKAGQKIPQSHTMYKWVAREEGQPTMMAKGQLLMPNGKPPEVSTYPVKPEGKPWRTCLYETQPTGWWLTTMDTCAGCSGLHLQCFSVLGKDTSFWDGNSRQIRIFRP